MSATSSGERAAEDIGRAPTSLLVETSKRLTPGRALDLACGSGRNALWLAEQGWSVTAVDGSPTAIEILRSRASSRGVTVSMKVATSKSSNIRLACQLGIFIAICYYLQRDLFVPAKQGVVPGGIVISIVHITSGRRADGGIA